MTADVAGLVKVRQLGPGKAASNAAYYRRRATAEAARGADPTYYAAQAALLEEALHATGRCRECGAPLYDRLSVARGYGPDCWQKPSVQDRLKERTDVDESYSAVQPAGSPATTKEIIVMATDTNPTTPGPVLAGKPALHDNCPKCGFPFPRPQAVCNSATACARRQLKAQGKESPRAQAPGTKPAVKGKGKKGGALGTVADLNVKLAERKAAKAAPVTVVTDDSGYAQAPVDEAPVADEAPAVDGEVHFARPEDAPVIADEAPAGDTVKVHLTSASMEAFIDGLFAGDLRTGRAGHWLVIHRSESGAVLARLSDAVEGAAGPAKRTAITVLDRVTVEFPGESA